MSKIRRLMLHDWPLHFVLLITNWLPDNVFIIRLRGRLARPFFKKCGKRLGIDQNVVFYNRQRRHRHLGGVRREAFEAALLWSSLVSRKPGHSTFLKRASFLVN